MTTFPAASLDRATPIDAVGLQELHADQVSLQIIDVRSNGEFQTGHIPGSFCIPLDVLNKHAGQVAVIDRPLVLVCQSGARASRGCEALIDAGATLLYILEGGVPGWVSAGFDINRTSADASKTERWPMDRQVRLVAGSIVSASMLAGVAVPPARWLAGAIGAGLTYSALSNTCGMAAVLSKLPYNRDDEYDFPAVLAKLKS